MRSLLIAAAALIAVAAPGIASAQTGGSVSLTIGSLDDDNDSNKDGVWGIDGIVLSEVGPNWSLQVQGRSYDVDHGAHSDGFSQVEVGLNYQINEAVAVGGFLGQINDIGSSYLTYGVAGSVSVVHDIRLAAGVSGADSINGDGDASNVVVMASMPLFNTVNVGIYGSWSDFDGFEAESLGLVADYNIPGTRFGVGAFYQTTDYDFGENEAFGLRLTMGFGDEDVIRRRLPGSEHLLYDSIASL